MWSLPVLLACAPLPRPTVPTLRPLAAAPSAGLVLHIVDQDGFPIPGVRVRAVSVSGSRRWSAQTDMQGIARLDPPAGTEVLITVSRSSFVTTELKVVIPEGGWAVGWVLERDPALEIMVIG